MPSHLQAPFSVADLSTATDYVEAGTTEAQETVFPDSPDVFEEDPMPEPEGAPENEPAPEPPDADTHPTTRSGRRIKLTTRLRESELLPKLQSFVVVVHHVVAVLA